MSVTIEKINKIDGEILTSVDIKKIDDNFDNIKTILDSGTSGGGTTTISTYTDFVI